MIKLDDVLAGPAGSTGDVELRDGDRLVVPRRSQEVTVMGEVQGPTSHLYQVGLSRNDYIERSGGYTQRADTKRVFVIRANGEVVGGSSSNWFRNGVGQEIHPGDTVIVPLDAQQVKAVDALDERDADSSQHCGRSCSG